MKGITVLGIGSELVADDGFGPAVVARLRAGETLDTIAGNARVEIVDGGVLGMKLLPYFTGSDAVVVIDAVDAGAEPGELFRFTPDEAGLTAGLAVSAHEIALPHVLDMTRLLGSAPEVVVIACQVLDAATAGARLSEPVAGAIDRAVELVAAEVRRLAGEP